MSQTRDRQRAGRVTSAVVVLVAVAVALAAALSGSEAAAAGSGPDIYLSSKRDGAVGAVVFKNEDIVVYDQQRDRWSLHFDGSDVGLGTTDITGFHIVDDDNPRTLDPILISIKRARWVEGLVPKVDDSDIIRFQPTSLGDDTAGTWSVYLDGSDVGLTADREDIDAIAMDPDGNLVISTVGANTVHKRSGVTFGNKDEDLLRFRAIRLGGRTTGWFERYFDGSDVGLRNWREDVVGAWLDPADGQIHLTTLKHFKVPRHPVIQLYGQAEDIIAFHGTVGPATDGGFSLFWDGNGAGFPPFHLPDGIHVGPSPDVPVTPTPTPTPPPMVLDYTTVGNTELVAGSAAATGPTVDGGAGVLGPRPPVDTSVALVDEPVNGTVELFPDGSFRYVPDLGFAGPTDRFTFTIDRPAGATGATHGQALIRVRDQVWYVDNTAAGTGASHDPMGTLAEAQTAAGPGDHVFVFAGDGTDTGLDTGFTMGNGQALVGEAAGLTVAGLTIVPPGSRPSISADGEGAVVQLADSTTVAGLAVVHPSEVGAGLVAAGSAGTLVVDDVEVSSGGDGIVLDAASGTFTFDRVQIVAGSGAGLAVRGGTAGIVMTAGEIDQGHDGAVLDIGGGHAGTLLVDQATTLRAGAGTGLQFHTARGVYDLRGPIDLAGGDAGIDVTSASSGTFRFGAGVITNPSGPALRVADLAAGGRVVYAGSVQSDHHSILVAERIAAGASVSIDGDAGETLRSTGNPHHAIDIRSADGNIEVLTPAMISGSTASSVRAHGGAGNWTLHDVAVLDQVGLDAGVDVMGAAGSVEFTDLVVTTASAGSGDAVVGFLARSSDVIRVNGDSRVAAAGGPAVRVATVASADMAWTELATTGSGGAQTGPFGTGGVILHSVAGGTFGADEVAVSDASTGIDIDGSGVAVSLASVNIEGVESDGVRVGTGLGNPGTVHIGGGRIVDTLLAGLRSGSDTVGSAASEIGVDATTFSGIGGFTVTAVNSALSGSGNTAVPFSCQDGGGNTGSMLFNGGTDSCP